MNVWFVSIMTVLIVLAALIFAIGVLLIGAGVIAVAAGSLGMLEPENHFVVGIDYGKHTNDQLDRLIDITERSVNTTVKVLEQQLDEEEDEDFEE